jgi:hypothetical protein
MNCSGDMATIARMTVSARSRVLMGGEQQVFPVHDRRSLAVIVAAREFGEITVERDESDR